MIVLDASVCAPWFLRDEDHPLSRQLADVLANQNASALVPALWHFEIRNVLLTAYRRGRMSEKTVAMAFEAVDRLPVDVDTSPDYAQALRLASRNALSFYDAAYLEVAKRRSMSLATLDRRLLAAARNESCSVFA